jgi:hypothetical protein
MLSQYHVQPYLRPNDGEPPLPRIYMDGGLNNEYIKQTRKKIVQKKRTTADTV